MNRAGISENVKIAIADSDFLLSRKRQFVLVHLVNLILSVAIKIAHHLRRGTVLLVVYTVSTRAEGDDLGRRIDLRVLPEKGLLAVMLLLQVDHSVEQATARVSTATNDLVDNGLTDSSHFSLHTSNPRVKVTKVLSSITLEDATQFRLQLTIVPAALSNQSLAD